MDLFRQALGGGAGGGEDEEEDEMEEEPLLVAEARSSGSSETEEEEEGRSWEPLPDGASHNPFDVSLPARHLVRQTTYIISVGCVYVCTVIWGFTLYKQIIFVCVV